MKRNALLLGNGGRESAIAYRLNSERVLVHTFPSNPFLSKYCISAPLNMEDFFASLLEYVKKEEIGLVVTGPEAYLDMGVTDFLSANGIPAFGPRKSAARIETDKSYAKDLMKQNNIPTAGFEIAFSKEECIRKSASFSFPMVLKVSGLAAGKGAFVVKDRGEFDSAVREIYDTKQFSASNSKVVMEEFMEGEEASLFALTDGERFVLFPPAQDFKRAYDNDEGPNTGGMGSYAPCGLVTGSVLSKSAEKIILPVLRALRNDNAEFRGLLYAGLMIKDGEPKVVEFNARFGDPETQSVLQVTDAPLYEMMLESANGRLTFDSIKSNGLSAVTVVLAAEGYPGDYRKSLEISVDESKLDRNAILFHAGTAERDGKIISTGGRMLNLTCFDKGLEKTIDNVYSNINKLRIDGSFYRKDIGKKGLKYENR